MIKLNFMNPILDLFQCVDLAHERITNNKAYE